MKILKEWIEKNKNKSKLDIFFDLETFQYNEAAGRKKPSEYKNLMYILAIGFFDEEKEIIIKYPNLFNFIEDLKESLENIKNKKKPSINFIAHNNNKYDNHFLIHDIKHFYPNIKTKNWYIRNATNRGNIDALTINQLKKQEIAQGVILEKRVKSKNNVEFTLLFGDLKLRTIDNYVKTALSIDTLGKKLLRVGVINEETLKQDYEYTKYNIDNDMTIEAAYNYANDIYKNLNEKELKYVDNDVLILMNSKKYYSILFNGFDYDKITFTSNILDYYKTNLLAEYQLTHKVDNIHIKYSDFHFNGMNLYQYFKMFFNGGANIYNYKFIGKIIENCFSIDLNSSYPYVMFDKKIPTFYKKSESFIRPKMVKFDFYNDNEFTMFEMTRQDYDKYIIERIDSTLIKQILVKYYGRHDNIYINTYTLRLIENITNLKILGLPVLSYVTYDCEYFGSRDVIDSAYKVKCISKAKNQLIYRSPTDIEETNIINNEKTSDEEVDQSKVILNGVFGIPALRAFFNLFRKQGEDYINIENGFINKERNIVFSVFVTAVALYNLIYPLKFLTQKEIDENILYTDTDSLYMKKDIYNKLPDELFHKWNLGKWDIEHKTIDKMYILNHKKYAIFTEGKIIVKSGGVRNESFDLNVNFEDFIEKQFSHGKEVESQRAILNKQGTISIYPSTIKLEQGKGYPVFSDTSILKDIKEYILNEARKQLDESTEDYLYIESNIGSFSTEDLYPHDYEKEDLNPIEILPIYEKEVKTVCQKC